MKNPIKELKLDLGGRSIVLTVEQAKNLKSALDELFGKDVIREIVRERDYYPYYPYQYPWYWAPTYPTYTWSVSDSGSCNTYAYENGTLALKVA